MEVWEGLESVQAPKDWAGQAFSWLSSLVGLLLAFMKQSAEAQRPYVTCPRSQPASARQRALLTPSPVSALLCGFPSGSLLVCEAARRYSRVSRICFKPHSCCFSSGLCRV